VVFEEVLVGAEHRQFDLLHVRERNGGSHQVVGQVVDDSCALRLEETVVLVDLGHDGAAADEGSLFELYQVFPVRGASFGVDDQRVVQGVLLAQLLSLNDLLLGTSLAIHRHAIEENALAHLRDVPDSRYVFYRALSDEARQLPQSI